MQDHETAMDAEQRFQLAMQHAGVGMALVAPDGTFMDANPALCDMLDRDAATLMASTWQELTHPDDLSVDLDLVGEVLTGQRDSYRLRKRFMRPDGTTIWGDLSVAAVRDDHGSVRYFISQIVDVTEHMVAEERFRLLAENSSDIVALVGVDGHVEWVSPSITRVLGWDAAALMGTQPWGLVHTDDREMALAALSDAALHGPAEQPIEVRLKTSGGDYLWLSAMGHNATDQQLVVSFRLVDAQVRTAQELEASQERYRLLAENASDVVIHSSSEGIVQWMSPSVAGLLGWRPDEMVGRPVFDIIHPEDLPAIMAAQPLITSGQAMNFEARVRAADGGYRWVAAHVRPVLDASGVVVGRVVGWRDIEAEHQARLTLRESQARYRLLAENASDVVYEVGPDRRVIWISPNVADTLGWTEQELLGASMYDLIHVDDRARIDALREAVFAGQEIANPPEGHPSRFLRKDGAYVWMSLKTTTIVDADGVMVSAVTGMRNVDALMVARHRAEADEARLQALLDGMLDPFVLLTADRDAQGRVIDFTFTDANPAALAVYQMERQDLLGQELSVLHPAAMTTDLFAMYVDVVDNGTPMILDNWAYPQDILDGQVLRYDVRGSRVGDSVSQIWRDVTDRHHAAELLAASEEQFRLIAENSTDVVLYARGGIMQWLSPSLFSTLGWEPDEWVGRAFEDFSHPDDVSLAQKRRAEISAGATAVTTMRMRDKRGVYHWVEIHAGPYTDAGGSQIGIVASFRIVDDEVAAEQELAYRARFDTLTGLMNRTELLHVLSNATGNVRRPGDHLALLFCDLDDFKDINDTRGHATGDLVLRTTADRVTASVRKDDSAARMGGDELVVLLAGVHDIGEATTIAEKIRTAAAAPIPTDTGAVTTTLSIGVTLAHPGEDADAVIARADQAMYAAKESGRNRVTALL